MARPFTLFDDTAPAPALPRADAGRVVGASRARSKPRETPAAPCAAPASGESLVVSLPCIGGRIHQKGNSKHIARFGEQTRLVGSAADMKAERALVAAARLFAPPAPIAVPVDLDLEVRYPVPPSWKPARRALALAGRIAPTGGGTHDVGNVLKLIEDVMEAAGFVVNDALIVGGQRRKVYSSNPGYEVRITPLDLVPAAPPVEPRNGSRARERAQKPATRSGGRRGSAGPRRARRAKR